MFIEYVAGHHFSRNQCKTVTYKTATLCDWKARNSKHTSHKIMHRISQNGSCSQFYNEK